MEWGVGSITIACRKGRVRDRDKHSVEIVMQLTCHVNHPGAFGHGRCSLPHSPLGVYKGGVPPGFQADLRNCPMKADLLTEDELQHPQLELNKKFTPFPIFAIDPSSDCFLCASRRHE
jgi:hypothetical protein